MLTPLVRRSRNALPETGPKIKDLALQYGQSMTFESGKLIIRNDRDALDSVTET